VKFLKWIHHRKGGDCLTVFWYYHRKVVIVYWYYRYYCLLILSQKAVTVYWYFIYKYICCVSMKQKTGNLYYKLKCNGCGWKWLWPISRQWWNVDIINLSLVNNLNNEVKVLPTWFIVTPYTGKGREQICFICHHHLPNHRLVSHFPQLMLAVSGPK
jgi:hypothetical protein